jgi:hypothetical protein
LGLEPRAWYQQGRTPWPCHDPKGRGDKYSLPSLGQLSDPSIFFNVLKKYGLSQKRTKVVASPGTFPFYSWRRWKKKNILENNISWPGSRHWRVVWIRYSPFHNQQDFGDRISSRFFSWPSGIRCDWKRATGNFFFRHFQCIFICTSVCSVFPKVAFRESICPMRGYKNIYFKDLFLTFFI